MTFAFHAAGTKDQVRRQLAAFLEQHVKWHNDPAHPQKVIDLIEHHLSIGEYAGGVYIDASGHLGDHSGTLQLNIKPLNLPAEAAPAAEPPTPASEPH